MFTAYFKADGQLVKCTPNLLPCHIHQDGPANASPRYWKPQSAADGTAESYFRGRRLKGKEVNIPEGYRGVVIKQGKNQRIPVKPTGDLPKDEDADADVSEMEEVGTLEELAEFDATMLWGHESVVELDHFLFKGTGEWIGFANSDTVCTALEVSLKATVMAPRDGSVDRVSTPDPVEKGFATLSTLRYRLRRMDGEKRKAEILSIQSRKGQPSYYVHYEEFNKRLDEWVSASRLDLSQEVEWPQPDAAVKKSQKSAAAPKISTQPKSTVGQKRPRASNASRRDSATPELSSTTGNAQPQSTRPSLIGGKENHRPGSDNSISVIAPEITTGTPKPEDSDLDLIDIQDAAAAAKAAGPTANQGPYSREEEIEKLRTGGSMTQNQTEISRVRNLQRIQMGKHEMEPWYFSPYPSPYTDTDMVYICEFCLSYAPSLKQFERHRAKCTLLHPPGNEIYRDDHVSFFEIDGKRQRRWCRNLCLLSKLFLDHKTLYYDVDPFLFYCMTTRDEHGCHLVGYFSKEKESAEGYNVACILTLPQFQRNGYGKLLIAFSYELSKREGKLGSPEKPLSDLGLLGYRAYWAETVVDVLTDEGRAGDINIDEVGALTAMTTNDVLHTLQNLNMLRYSKGQHVIVLTKAVLAQKEQQKEKEKVKGKRRIDPERLQWKPPVFTASSRTWNW
ncbi:MAG: hypothetical protein LQ342_000825 [Letrouitia transgressa]|nr:MAG: hypothetical protein LQ342_000825 [Letrouitia transgressa]